MGKINIQISRETHKKLEEIGRKGQSFDDIVNDCIREYLNNQHYDDYYYAIRVEGEMHLEYGKVSIPNHIKGKKVKELDLIDCFAYLCEQNDCEVE